MAESTNKICVSQTLVSDRLYGSDQRVATEMLRVTFLTHLLYMWSVRSDMFVKCF